MAAYQHAFCPRSLTRSIKGTTTLQQLQQLVQQHGAAMNYIHIAAAVTLLGQWKTRSSSHDQPAVFQLLGQLEQLLQPQILQQCGCRELSNMVWAICALRYTHTALFSACVEAFMSKLPAVDSPQDVSNVLYGVAECSKQLNPAQVQQLLAALVRPDSLYSAEPQALANTLWAVATMGQQVPEQQQLQQLLAAFVSKLSAATPQAVSNTLWACAAFNYLPGDLLAAVATQPYLDTLVAGTNPQVLANTALACAQLGHRDDKLMGALLQRAGQLLGQQGSSNAQENFTVQGLCNICWSVAVLDLQQHAAQLPGWVQTACQQWGDIKAEELWQLYQVHIWLLDFQLAGGQGLAMTGQQLEQCTAAVAAQLEDTAAEPPSDFQSGVFALMQQLVSSLSWQQQPAMEQLSQPDGALLIDITGVTADGVLLAIEVDGPTHFRRPDRQLTGPTLYRNRALTARGYTVISIPGHHWAKLKGDKQRQQYLMQLIGQHCKGQQQQPQMLRRQCMRRAGSSHAIAHKQQKQQRRQQQQQPQEQPPSPVQQQQQRWQRSA